jgi:thiamine pyrophosphate-dependent acetolactate synthase large subunit-like protein
MQESKLAEPLPPIDSARFMPAAPVAPANDLVSRAAAALRSAQRPVILAGRVSRSMEAWEARVALAETLSARVVTDLKTAAAFPTDHPLHAGAPATLAPVPEAADAIRAADLILSLDWIDLAGTLRTVCGASSPRATIIQASVDHQLHNGWSMDYQALPPVDILLACEPDAAVAALLGELGAVGAEPRFARVAPAKTAPLPSGDGLTVNHLAQELRRAVGERAVSLLHLPLSWDGATWPFRHPLDYIGFNGGGGVGAGPGIAVGAALALKDTRRLPVAICGDGDFLMGVTALWTAAHYRIPLLLVIANNRSFFNDELHQERVARMRNRPVENRWIGQRISDPDIDLAQMGRAQGARGFGPLARRDELQPAFEQAIAAVEQGAVAVVDVRVDVGYGAAMTAAMAPKPERS